MLKSKANEQFNFVMYSFSNGKIESSCENGVNAIIAYNILAFGSKCVKIQNIR